MARFDSYKHANTGEHHRKHAHCCSYLGDDLAVELDLKGVLLAAVALGGELEAVGLERDDLVGDVRQLDRQQNGRLALSPKDNRRAASMNGTNGKENKENRKKTTMVSKRLTKRWAERG